MDTELSVVDPPILIHGDKEEEEMTDLLESSYSQPKSKELAHLATDLQRMLTAATILSMCETLWSCCQRFTLWLQSTAACVYFSHFLSAWGDRMWMFAVGMYLADLSPDNLRLVASFGFSVGTAGVLMGAIIGDIVDRYPRLIVARTALAGQNLGVALCAVLVCFTYQYKKIIYSEDWSSGLCEAGIIVLAIVAHLFSTAHKISVEKDWISVICERDSARLAKLSSTVRAIDQFTIICAPILTGLLMTYGSMMASALFVAGWNVCSVFVEYSLLLRIYNRVPMLAIKVPATPVETPVTPMETSATPGETPATPVETPATPVETPATLAEVPATLVETPVTPVGTPATPVETPATQNTAAGLDISKGKSDIIREDEQAVLEAEVKESTEAADVLVAEKELLTAEYSEGMSANMARTQRETSPRSGCLLCCTNAFSAFIVLKTGWSTYFSYDVKFAGMGLALVYMTVLGFDNITVGYAYNQGASQAVLGGLMSVGALTGIAATFTYPKMRKRLGIERTGLIGFWAEIFALSLCVFSIWSPGSPFNLAAPFYGSHSNSGSPVTSDNSTSLNGSLSTQSGANGTVETKNGTEHNPNIISLTLLMAGIIAARYGLWTLDLAISQLLLERVEPSQRGVVNGVQSSLNMIMDMLKFILVIAIPSPQHFGLLIIFSFLAICLGGVSYAFYSYKIRGHLFHFDKLLCCHTNSNNLPPTPVIGAPPDLSDARAQNT